MAGIDLNRDALLKLQAAVTDRGGQLAAVGDGYPAKGGAGSSLFGTLEGAAGLASAIGKVENHVHDEFTAVKERLNSVAKALDTIDANIEYTNEHTKKALPKV